MSGHDHDAVARTAHAMLGFSAKLTAGVASLAAMPRDLDAGATPREAVWSLDRVRLQRFEGATPRAGLPPLLIAYALVNRPYMLDLEPERSFVRGLLEGGREVYLVDWGYPEADDRGLGLDDYVLRYLHGCVQYLCARHGTLAVDLLGVCQGGTLALCYTALEPASVRRLALMVTPVDFHAEGFLLAHWLRYVDVDRLVDTLGNVPGSMLNWAFLALKPLSLSGRKALDLIEILDDPAQLATFARMERWLHDNPDQAGRAFREFANAFFRRNALMHGGLTIGGREVALGHVHQPVLNVLARQDHIVPPAASRALSGLLARQQVRELVFDGGHIGVFASRHARSSVPRAVCQWFEGAD
jgi:polyhydroxyalkanoate synthase